MGDLLNEAVGLYAPFLANRPGVRVVYGPPRTEVVDGCLLSVQIRTLGIKTMLAHEIAHVIEATDEELFVPGLGLTDGRSTSPPDKVWREIEVWKIQRHVMKRVGATLTFAVAERMAMVVLNFNGFRATERSDYKKKLAARLEDEFDEMAAWAEWDRKLDLIAKKQAATA